MWFDVFVFARLNGCESVISMSERVCVCVFAGETARKRSREFDILAEGFGRDRDELEVEKISPSILLTIYKFQRSASNCFKKKANTKI